MKHVFVTRKIPDNGLTMLKAKGYEVDVNPLDRPLSRAELIASLRAKPYDAALTLLTDTVDAGVMDAAPAVKIFANYAIGFNNFDVIEGKRRGIFMTNTPGGGADRVAEHTWALILALSCRVVEGDRFVRDGKYTGWDPMLLPGLHLKGKTIGLIGAGTIGTEVARIGALGFGLRVIYYDIKRNEGMERIDGATFYPTIEEVLKQADIVSIHVPLMDVTRHLINAERLKLMKPTACLVNTARGPVVDEAALVKALQDKAIAGAGLDVFENEPQLTPGLKELPNVVLTPHIASATVDSREDMARMAVENIINTLEGGRPANVVYN